jgi:hypothetical protein
VGAAAAASRDANIKALARGTAPPATAPGAQQGNNTQVDSLDERIRQKTGMANKTTIPQDETVDTDKTDERSDSKKTVFIASHQQVSTERDLPALEIKEETIDNPEKTGSEKFEGTFKDEGYTKTEDDDDDAYSQVSVNPEDIESGNGEPGLVEAVAVDPESDDEYIPAAV